MSLSRQKYHTPRRVQSPVGHLFINNKSKLRGRYPMQEKQKSYKRLREPRWRPGNCLSGPGRSRPRQGRSLTWRAPFGKSVKSRRLLSRIGSWGYSPPLGLPVPLSGKTNSFLKGASPSVAGVLHSADWRYAMDALWLRLVDIGGIRPPPPLPWAAWPEGLGPGCHTPPPLVEASGRL